MKTTLKLLQAMSVYIPSWSSWSYVVSWKWLCHPVLKLMRPFWSHPFHTKRATPFPHQTSTQKEPPFPQKTSNTTSHPGDCSTCVTSEYLSCFPASNNSTKSINQTIHKSSEQKHMSNSDGTYYRSLRNKITSSMPVKMVGGRTAAFTNLTKQLLARPIKSATCFLMMWLWYVISLYENDIEDLLRLRWAPTWRHKKTNHGATKGARAYDPRNISVGMHMTAHDEGERWNKAVHAKSLTKPCPCWFFVWIYEVYSKHTKNVVKSIGV